MSQKLLKNRTWGIVLSLIGVLLFLTGQPSPVSAQSADVVIIGGTSLDLNNPCSSWGNEANVMGSTYGGCLPVAGTIDLNAINFTAMDPSVVSAASLAAYDTAVLNMASNAMACNSNNLSAQAQADLVAFVASGKKLIIYDSECSPGLNYGWLPYPFTTSNPGAMGAPGTLTVVEDNPLSGTVGDPSCLGGDPCCIDVAYLGPSTDAVGDMNVMTTLDPNWCLDMSGTNYNNVTGPVHTYADYPANTDRGLIIYNGLDMDYMSWSGTGHDELQKIWVQELQQPFNPSLLPCFGTVVGIKLDPETDTNPVGTTHTVTATLKDLLGNPQIGVLVTFTIVSGPNAGASGTCSANADCTTDANGQVSFTYTSDGNVGDDEIAAEFTADDGTIIESNKVKKEWILSPITECDVDGDGDIDFNDIRAILGARGTPASGPLDPADVDRDGLITPHDAKLCIQDCDNPGCAP